MQERQEAPQDLSSLGPGRIVEGVHTNMAYGLAVVPSPAEGSVRLARQEAGLGARVCISWSRSCSPRYHRAVGGKSDPVVSVGLPKGSPCPAAPARADVTSRAVVGCACSWGGIGRLLSHVPGEDLKLGRSSGDSTPLGGADLLSPVPSATESHPGAQPLHGDDGGQPEEAPRQWHPRQPQWGHCTQQRRGDQDHLLGEHVRMSLCPTVPPSCCSFLCPPLHSPVGHCVPLMQPGSPLQGWAARVRARGRLEQAVSLGALFKLGSFCGRTKDKLPGVLAPK